MNEKTNINWYPGHMAKTKRLIEKNFNLIDIVYEVVDARIPSSSKIKDIYNIIKNKPSIVIMTKKGLLVNRNASGNRYTSASSSLSNCWLCLQGKNPSRFARQA